jgi:hypothetical protein
MSILIKHKIIKFAQSPLQSSNLSINLVSNNPNRYCTCAQTTNKIQLGRLPMIANEQAKSRWKNCFRSCTFQCHTDCDIDFFSPFFSTPASLWQKVSHFKKNLGKENEDLLSPERILRFMEIAISVINNDYEALSDKLISRNNSR